MFYNIYYHLSLNNSYEHRFYRIQIDHAIQYSTTRKSMQRLGLLYPFALRLIILYNINNL